MRLVCSYCRRIIRSNPGGRVTDVTHGMCGPCAAHFERLWAGMPLEEYLDGIASPVLLVNEEGRIIAMNQQLADRVPVERNEVRGLKDCEALACAHSRLPEGCGRTVHCRECAVRRTVQEVARTGEAREHVPAYLDTDAGRVDLRICVHLVDDGVVRVTVEEMGEARKRQPKG